MLVILVPVVCACVFLAEEVYDAADLVSSSLMVGAVFPLCLLLLINRLLAASNQRPLIVVALICTVALVGAATGTRFPFASAALLVGIVLYFGRAWLASGCGPIWSPFSRRELLLIYIGITVSTWFSSMGGVEFLLSSMTSPFFFGRDRDWSDLRPLIPRWISVRKPAVIDPFFHGNVSWIRADFLQAWIVPVTAWTLFTLCFFGFALSLNLLLRKQWIEYERLSFPIAQVPLQLTLEGREHGLWRSPGFWMGALLAFILEAVNGIHQVIPTVPLIPILPTELGGVFTTRPWNGIGSIPAAFYPWILGLAYLAPLDVSFSSWFFFLVSRVSGVVAVAAGFRLPGAADISAAPYQMDQGFGAFIALALFSLWSARGHIGALWRSAWNCRGDSGDRNEARVAFSGLTFCGVGLLIWFWLISGSVFVMATWMLVYILVVLAASRMRAEAGPGWIVAPRWPQDIFYFSSGSMALSHGELAAISTHTWLAQDIRHTPMATQMEGLKMGDVAGLQPLRLAGAMVVCMVLAAVASFWTGIGVTYRYGYATAQMHQWRLHQGLDLYGWMHSWMNGAPMKPNPGIVLAWVVGFVVVAFLTRMRQLFVWWPFHPVGYAIGNTFSMTWLWLPTLIAWGVKALAIRYGGLSGYRKGIPFAVGLILGDFVVSGLFAVISVTLGVPIYKTFPVP